ncbi:MAG: FtsW/RodA/SpoVE family cell cycle protein [Fibromonadales bacterium]|nr:FtsW/RodA/SpoVE family cell cycle protein [Fibromonadales bacterium]
MVYVVDYFHNVWERIKFGKWLLLLAPLSFSIIGIYISISTLDKGNIPFKSFAVENALMPLVFFAIGFLLPVSLWRRYAVRFAPGEKLLWNRDGLSYAFFLLLFAMGLQIFAIWGDSSWDRVGPYTDGNAITQMRRQLSVFSRPFQVGEFVKIFLMIFVAKMLIDMRIKKQMRLCKEFFGFPLAALMSVGFFTFLMPNYSMLLIYMIMVFFMIFLQEMDIKPRLTMIAALVIPAVIASSIANLDKDSPLAKIHGINRVWNFFNEEGVGNEQQNEALQALADGGITGKGWDNGTIKRRLFGARNDFAYSVLGEELGFWLMVPITIAMAGFLFTCFWVAANIEPTDRNAIFAQNLAWGIAIIFALNVIFHIGVNLRLLPNTGQPLSFVSSGGANLAMNFFLMGMLVQISSLINKDKSI